MTDRISSLTLDQLFLEARSHNAWQDRDVPDSILKEIVDITKMGPTSANCCPARFVFVKSQEAKKQLSQHVMEANVKKVEDASACAIIGYDLEFYQHLPRLFPHTDAKSWFEGKPDHIETTAFRNSSLQGAYFMLAARALGLDVGPMSGFDNDAVDKEFFPGGTVKSNFICSIGYGDPSALFDRSPRFDFSDMAEIL